MVWWNNFRRQASCSCCSQQMRLRLNGSRANFHQTCFWQASGVDYICLNSTVDGNHVRGKKKQILNIQLSSLVPACFTAELSVQLQWPGRTLSDPDRQFVRLICSWDLRCQTGFSSNAGPGRCGAALYSAPSVFSSKYITLMRRRDSSTANGLTGIPLAEANSTHWTGSRYEYKKSSMA